MTLGCFIVEFPCKLIRESSVIVLFNFSVELLHPTHFDEEFGEVLVGFLPQPFLHTVTELVVAVLFPELVNSFEVSFGDELDLGEEDISAFLSCFTG